MRSFHDPKWNILSKYSNVQAISTNYKITHHNTPKTLKAYILDTILSISLSSSPMLLLTQLTEQTDIFCSSWRGMCVPIYKNLQLLAPQKGDKKNYITPGISSKKIAAAILASTNHSSHSFKIDWKYFSKGNLMLKSVRHLKTSSYGELASICFGQNFHLKISSRSEFWEVFK